MPAIDLLLFTTLALVVGLVMGWKFGYRAGKSRGEAEGQARCHDIENRLKELQSQAQDLLGIEQSPDES